MIVIHIGLSKAGSSTIQNFFSKNSAKLLHLSVDYPSVALSSNNHHNLAHEINGSRKYEEQDDTLSQLIAYRKISRRPKLFISSEVFGFFTDKNIQALKDRLSASGERDFMIILIIRDHVDRMPSSYAQKTKYGHHAYDFDEFFEEKILEERGLFRSCGEMGQCFRMAKHEGPPP